MTQEELTGMEPPEAARQLLGATLVSMVGGEQTVGVIVETEAYLPSDDFAAHQTRGKTAATASLYQPAGTLYVHRMRHHSLLDIVVGPPESPGSVLLRALQPTVGQEIMARRRGVTDERLLCSGPGKLCAALGISKAHDGVSIFASNSPVTVLWPTVPQSEPIVAGPRIGISKSTDLPLRFYFVNNPFVS